MFRIFFFISFINVFTNAISPISNFYEAVVKDLDSNDVSFQKYNGKCVLVVNHQLPEVDEHVEIEDFVSETTIDDLKSSFSLVKENIEFLNNLKERMPNLEIVTIQSYDKNEQIKSMVPEDLKLKYDVTAPVDVRRNDVLKFLAKRSGQMITANYDKYLVEKDGLTVTKYENYDGPIQKNSIQYGLERCLDDKIRDFTDYIGIDIEGHFRDFKIYKNKFVIVSYIDFDKMDQAIQILKDLVKLKRSYINENLNILVFPSSNSSPYLINEKKTTIDKELKYDIDLITLMAPINSKIEDTTIYKFLFRQAQKFNPQSDVFIVRRDSLNVSVHNRIFLSYLNLSLYNYKFLN